MLERRELDFNDFKKKKVRLSDVDFPVDESSVLEYLIIQFYSYIYLMSPLI